MPLKIQHDELPTLNLTSMIDVLFLLIIFFMVATKFDEMERNIEVAVPEVGQAGDSTPTPQPMVVTVRAEGGLELDGAPVTVDELTTRLAAARTPLTEPSVVIRGDAQCAFQHIASALAACQQAGISDLGITVRLAGIGAAKRQ
ncbi:MAG: biopolymer transporter ExbD [Pirellulales bacterium]